MIRNQFTFAVLTFNHESYIIEHLESIKFLIESFGSAYDFNLIVADDGSRDQTVALVKGWLLAQGALFFDVKILGDGTNNGTCANYTKIWPLIEGDLFKITAGDDVYSGVNIFKEVERLRSNDFFSGLPLLLVDGQLLDSKSTIFHILASEIIYKGKKFIARLNGISSINTPNLFCSKKFLLDGKLSDFINSYSVIEDFPMMVKIAETYENISFNQSHNIYVYYRRTSGSTYLVRGSDFDLDKLRAFDHLLSLEKSWLGKLMLKNRIYCYKLDNKLLKKLININYYVYLFKVMINLRPILKAYSESPLKTSTHQAHYNLIVKRANAFQQSSQKKPTIE